MSGNRVELAPALFVFSRAFGLRPAGFDMLKLDSGDKSAYFSDNRFEGNNLISSKQPGFASSSFNFSQVWNNDEAIDFLQPLGTETLLLPSDIQINNNIFVNNNFGTELSAPEFSPALVATDGGGNICKVPSDQPSIFGNIPSVPSILDCRTN